MHSGAGDWQSRQPGSPIRTPPDQRSVDSSPGPIAASHVLHRLLVPRHPPCALNNLHTHTQAPTHRRPRLEQRSASSRHYNRNQTHRDPKTPMIQKSTLKTAHPPTPRKRQARLRRSRCSHPLSSSQTPRGHPDTQRPPPNPHTQAPSPARNPHAPETRTPRDQKPVWRASARTARDNKHPTPRNRGMGP